MGRSKSTDAAGAAAFDRKTSLEETTSKGPFLIQATDGLTLTDGSLSMRADLTESLPRLNPDRLSRELLVRAAKIKNNPHPIAIDMTAGLGEDSLLLAAAGFTVYLFEKDPVIAALLEDALARAAGVPDLRNIIGRMHLLKEDSIAALRNHPIPQSQSSPQISALPQDSAAVSSPGSPSESALSSPADHDRTSPIKSVSTIRPDVIYLDPMFPERRKSGLIKKKFQLLQQLETPCDNEEELLAAAIAAHPHKIVIKRPLKGPYLAGKKPDYSISGKAIRYDCHVFV